MNRKRPHVSYEERKERRALAASNRDRRRARRR
jgi:hypothetical protein